MSYFDRYSQLRVGNEIGIVPFVEILKSNSDVYITYEKGKTRLDQVSYQYYGSSDYAWLIMEANPQYGSLEFRIPDKSELRIPYPLANALTEYNSTIKNNKKIQ